LMRRINAGKIDHMEVPHFMDGEGYSLEPSHIEKGRKWLINQWKTPTGAERQNNPFGFREENILQNLETIKLKSVYSPRGNYYYPYYSVETHDRYFAYYVEGGKINILE